jgi:hypothetical protein
MKKPFKISKSNQRLIQGIADDYFGGHFTILTFTTCYSFMFGTPSDRDDISGLESFYDVNDAIVDSVQKFIINIKDGDYGRK